MPPPWTKWSRDFDTLLKNSDGFNLFQRFLKENDALHCIELWGILKGYKERFKQAPTVEMVPAAKIIYRKLYKCDSPTVDHLLKQWLSEEAKKEVIKIIRMYKNCESNEKRDATPLNRVFDEPFRELVAGMKDKFYTAFLHSDIYLRYVQNTEYLRTSDGYSMSGSEKALEQTNNNNNNNGGQIHVGMSHSYPSRGDPLPNLRCNLRPNHVKGESHNEGTLPSNPSQDEKLVQVIMEKLVKVKKEREAEENATFTLKKISRFTGERFAAIPPQLLLEAMKDKLTDSSANDASDQSILDEHICRVWSPDRSPITRSRSEVKHCHPPVASRDEYFVDGGWNPQSTSTLLSQKKVPTYNKNDMYKWSTPSNDYHQKQSNSYMDSDHDTYNDSRLSSRKYGGQLPQRSYGDGMSNANLNAIGQENELYRKGRQDYEGLLKSLPTPQYPGMQSIKMEKKFDKRRSAQQMTKSLMKPGLKSNEVLTIGYKFADEQVPYMKKLNDCSCLTLAEFKQMIPPRRGPLVYYFKKESNEFGTGYVMEEITDDNEMLPMNEGRKIYAVIESASRHN